MYRGDRSRKETLVEYGFRLPSALDNRPMRFDEFTARAPQTIFVSATPSQYELEHSDNIAEQLVRPTGLLDPVIEVRPVATQVDDLLSEINKRNVIGERVLVTTLTKRYGGRFDEYLEEHHVRVRYLHRMSIRLSGWRLFAVCVWACLMSSVGINLLREGLDLPEVSLVCNLDADKKAFYVLKLH